MDSYLAGELLVETNHELLRHLETCPTCRNELAARRGLLAQMRSAVKNARPARVNQAFAVRLRNDLRQTALRPGVWEKVKSKFFAHSPIFAAALAACLLIGVLFGSAIWTRRGSVPEDSIALQNQTAISVETLPGSAPDAAANVQFVQAAWRETRATAIGDHKNCALKFRLREDPITLDQAAEKYGRFNKNLDKTAAAALQQIPAQKIFGKSFEKIEFLEAHSCVFRGRRFAHIVFRRGKKTISVLVTGVDSTDEKDETIDNQSGENFQSASFRTKRHAVFVVSNLTEEENLIVAEILAPAVKRHIEQAEA